MMPPKEVIEQILDACGGDPNEAAPVLVGLRLAGYVIVSKDAQQKLVDLMFEIALKSAESMGSASRDTIASWVRDALAVQGYRTEPIGSSWGVIRP